jgi:hypothetical protein
VEEGEEEVVKEEEIQDSPSGSVDLILYFIFRITIIFMLL